MMIIRPIFSDDESSSISHYGVKGMRWGVRNAETLRKYNLKKGYTLRRYTSKHEAKKGTNLGLNFYAIQNQKDFEAYGKKIDTLPSTSKIKNGRFERKIGVVSYEATSDISVLKGKAVLNDMLKQYGNTPTKEFFDNAGYGSYRESLKIKGEQTVNQVLNDKSISKETKKAVSRRFAGDILGSTDDTSKRRLRTKNNKDVWVNHPGKTLLESYRKSGYDAIEDIEDQLSVSDTFNPEAPLLVINGSKFKQTNSKLVKRKRF